MKSPFGCGRDGLAHVRVEPGQEAVTIDYAGECGLQHRVIKPFGVKTKQKKSGSPAARAQWPAAECVAGRRWAEEAPRRPRTSTPGGNIRRQRGGLRTSARSKRRAHARTHTRETAGGISLLGGATPHAIAQKRERERTSAGLSDGGAPKRMIASVEFLPCMHVYEQNGRGTSSQRACHEHTRAGRAGTACRCRRPTCHG